MTIVSESGNGNINEGSEDQKSKKNLAEKSGVSTMGCERQGDKAPPPQIVCKKPETTSSKNQNANSTEPAGAKTCERSGDKAPPPSIASKKPDETDFPLAKTEASTNGSVSSKQPEASKKSLWPLILCFSGVTGIGTGVAWVFIYRNLSSVPYFQEIIILATTMLALGWLWYGWRLIKWLRYKQPVEVYRTAEKSRFDGNDELLALLYENLSLEEKDPADKSSENTGLKDLRKVQVILDRVDKRLFSDIRSKAINTAMVTAISPNKTIDFLSVMVSCFQIMHLICRTYGIRPAPSIFIYAATYSLTSGVSNETFSLLTNTISEDLPFGGKAIAHGSKFVLEAYFNYYLMSNFAIACVEKSRPLEIRKENLEKTFEVSMFHEFMKKTLGEQSTLYGMIKTINSTTSEAIP